ncbi:hypothetical protein SNE40_002675 [Patella caerulea]|uniref:Tyrosine-protein kinase BAZ1B n=1 Tax=Patella caerulea TaxID=87958 RepID=A0AAN8Q027_PATCE
MPLLGKKIFAPSKPLADIQPNETVYTIPYTGEKFRQKSEYDQRCMMYKERIWTCQCTGHVNLSYEEAWNSEKAVHKTIKDQFFDCFKKPTLEIVHHATVSLDNLVDQAWLKLQQVLCIGEHVTLKVKSAAKIIKATVVSVDTSGVNANPTSNCSSPSSDKENSASEGKEASPKKWLPPKLLPYKYSIRLEDEDKVINAVPASDLSRNERPPPKDLLRLFIRANTVRAGHTPTSPWVVNEAMVQKYKLPSKFADFLLSPAKMAEAAKRAEEEISRKRKASKSRDRSSKKQKLDKNSKSPKKKKKLSEMKVKKSANKGVIEIDSDSSSDDEVVLSKVVRKSTGGTDSDSDTPLMKMKLTPKKRSKSADTSSDSDDEPLINLGSANKKSPKKKKTSSPKKSRKQSTSSSDKKKRGRPKKGEERVKIKLKKKKSSEKGLKQMTLFEVASKKGGKSPSKTTPRKLLSPVNITPAIVSQLVKAQGLEDKTKFIGLVKKAAVTLTATQRNSLPKSVKTEVVQKYEQNKERQLIAKMTPAERETYFKKKRQERKQERNKRYEDQGLKLTPLPVPKLVSSPDSLPNEVFGDIAMVTEMISCYKGLLMPDDEYPIYTDALMKALATGPNGFAYLSRVLGVLLQTLLQDGIAEGYTELKVKLSDIPVNPFTVSELVRLCLRSNDTGEDEDDMNDDQQDVDVAQNIIDKLEDEEFYQLDPSDKLAILKGLCLRIMGSYSVQDYMEDKQVQAVKLTKQKYAEQREMNEKNKKDKQQKEENKSENPTPSSSNTSQNTSGLVMSAFYGTLDKVDSDSNPTTETVSADDEDNLVTTIRSRRVNAAKVAAEKAKREEERRKQIEKDMAEYKKQKEKENFDKTYKDGIEAAKQTLRLVPIGTDRNHNRYWIFNSTTPGLYIEKGWVTDDYSYNVQSGGNEPVAKLLTPKKSNVTVSPQVTPSKSPKKNAQIAPSFPHVGQNLWFEYDSVKDLDQLIKALHPQGLRESNLKAEITKRYDDITKAINISKRTNLELRDSDGDVEILAGIRREILEMEVRLRNGGLGGVPDFSVWEQKVLTCEKLDVFGTLLLDVQANVLEKFLKGIMKPKTLPTVTTTTVKTEVKDGESDEEEEDDEKSSMPKTLIDWIQAVENCQTISRLHVLLGILETSIRWEKSAENAKCKICRKKDNDDRLLLCDECNQAFHMYCLRPALRDVPKGDWFCAACAPTRRPTHNYRRFGFDEPNYDDNATVGGTLEHEDTCAECGGDEDLIECSVCPLVYHTFCHDPVLRYPPRGHWECMECKNGGKRRKGKRGSKPSKRAGRRQNYNDDDTADSSEEEYKPNRPPPKKVKPVSKRSTSKSRSAAIEPDDTPPKTNRRAPSELSLCEDILTQLVKHKCSWPFAEAVSKKDVPDYYTIVKHPMDFRTMRNKFMTYSSAQEFIDDLSLVFRNTAQYNKEDTEIYQCMLTLEKLVGQLISAYLPNHIYSRDVVANGYHDHGYSSKRKRR